MEHRAAAVQQDIHTGPRHTIVGMVGESMGKRCAPPLFVGLFQRVYNPGGLTSSWGNIV